MNDAEQAEAASCPEADASASASASDSETQARRELARSDSLEMLGSRRPSCASIATSSSLCVPSATGLMSDEDEEIWFEQEQLFQDAFPAFEEVPSAESCSQQMHLGRHGHGGVPPPTTPTDFQMQLSHSYYANVCLILTYSSSIFGRPIPSTLQIFPSVRVCFAQTASGWNELQLNLLFSAGER